MSRRKNFNHHRSLTSTFSSLFYLDCFFFQNFYYYLECLESKERYTRPYFSQLLQLTLCSGHPFKRQTTILLFPSATGMCCDKFGLGSCAMYLPCNCRCILGSTLKP